LRPKNLSNVALARLVRAYNQERNVFIRLHEIFIQGLVCFMAVLEFFFEKTLIDGLLKNYLEN